MENALTQSQLQQSQNVYDMNSLNTLRESALKGDEKALEQAAKQFESIFLGMMLKSMRQASEVLADEDNPLSSKEVKYYQDMFDKQLASNLSAGDSVGLADLIVQQLGNPEGYTPASVIRNDGNLSSINRQVINTIEQAEKAVMGPMTEAGHKGAAFDSPDAFARALLPAAERAAERLGVEPKAIIAQAALETGWGQHMIHMGSGNNSHNLFGIKANSGWAGDKAVVNTLEFRDGMPKTEKAAFRAYGSFDESLDDYVNFVQNNPRYAKALASGGDTQEYFQQLQQAGYATDPSYADKVLRVLESDALSSL